VQLFFLYSVSAFSQRRREEAGGGSGRGSGGGIGTKASTSDKTPVRILSSIPAVYTDAAKKNYIEGDVTLRVTFLASGEIGAISVVSGLSYGLTEQAITAAKNIRFEPAKRNGQPITVMKTVKFNFMIYSKEDDDDIKTKAVILEQPMPEYPLGENFKNLRGTVKIKLALTSFGEIQIQTVSGNLPKEFEDKAIEAAKKIKYEPAIYANKAKASVVREIEYEFKPAN
jgi:TonB family protein